MRAILVPHSDIPAHQQVPSTSRPTPSCRADRRRARRRPRLERRVRNSAPDLPWNSPRRHAARARGAARARRRRWPDGSTPVSGGGGLVQLPALLVALPDAEPATVLGTNKSSSIIGTSAAALTYRRAAVTDVATARPHGARGVRRGPPAAPRSPRACPGTLLPSARPGAARGRRALDAAAARTSASAGSALARRRVARAARRRGGGHGRRHRPVRRRLRPRHRHVPRLRRSSPCSATRSSTPRPSRRSSTSRPTSPRSSCSASAATCSGPSASPWASPTSSEQSSARVRRCAAGLASSASCSSSWSPCSW